MVLIIRYNTESNKWLALSEKSPDFVASSEVSGPSLLLGPQVWLVSNDSAGCSGQAASYTARLSLSACQGGRQSGPLSLVEVLRDTVLSLVELYYVYNNNITTQAKYPLLGAFSTFQCVDGMIP